MKTKEKKIKEEIKEIVCNFEEENEFGNNYIWDDDIPKLAKELTELFEQKLKEQEEEVREGRLE